MNQEIILTANDYGRIFVAKLPHLRKYFILQFTACTVSLIRFFLMYINNTKFKASSNFY